MPEPLPDDFRVALENSAPAAAAGSGRRCSSRSRPHLPTTSRSGWPNRGHPKAPWHSRWRRRRAAAATAASGSRRRAPESTSPSCVARRRSSPPSRLPAAWPWRMASPAPPGLPVAIKWPNDVVVHDTAAPGKRRKLAGILAEGAAGPTGVQHVVLGCGINVRPADYPRAGRAVTSIEHELGRPVEPALVLAEVLAALNEQADALIAGKRHKVLAAGVRCRHRPQAHAWNGRQTARRSGAQPPALTMTGRSWSGRATG